MQDASEQGDNMRSLFLQWGKSGEYASGQIEAWEALRSRDGEVWQPEPVGSL